VVWRHTPKVPTGYLLGPSPVLWGPRARLPPSDGILSRIALGRLGYVLGYVKIIPRAFGHARTYP
jgi:hypothetical protein